MTLPELSLALLALLIAPGPTNAVLALAGAERGLRGAWALCLLVLVCYLAVVIPLDLAGAAVFERLPLLRPLVTVTAAVWVMVLAVRLWRPGADDTPEIRARQLAVTTLLNPKALVFGLVILPDAAEFWQGVLVFSVLVPLVSLVWIGLGAGLRASPALPLQRGAAVWLALVSLFLISRVLA